MLPKNQSLTMLLVLEMEISWALFSLQMYDETT
jgi:hypothetical protein